MRRIFFRLLSLILLVSVLGWVRFLEPPQKVYALGEVSPYDLINAINSIRTSNGLPALEVNSVLMGTAQGTSDYMAANDFCSHLGGVSERVAAAGYGGGATVWATENFSCGPKTVQAIVYSDWADDLHMLPMTNGNYTHIGAGVSYVDSYGYFVVHAAYTSGGTMHYSSSTTPLAVGTGTQSVSQVILPVETASPQDNGAIVHVVQQGQTLWSIALAYNVTTNDLIALNGLDTDNPVIYAGQKLYIRGGFTATVSPTITETPRPATWTPRPTYTPRPAKSTGTLGPTITPTSPPLLPNVSTFESLNRQSIGIGFIIVSGLGLLVLLVSTMRGRRG